MPVNFYAKPCSNPQGNCQTESIECLQLIQLDTFGISDVEGGNGLPAKITECPNPETDFVVNNKSGIDVFFKAVDWCVPICRTGTYNLDDDDREPSQFSSDDITEGDFIKRCEGFLQFNDTVVFIEIKDRPRGSWLKDAREKFEETILSFREHHSIVDVKIEKPRLCNPSFHRIHQNEMMQKKILKDKIGIEFIRENSIDI
jgi:hypothetical protein